MYHILFSPSVNHYSHCGIQFSICRRLEQKADNSYIVHFPGDDKTSNFSKYGSTIISIWYFSELINILILSLLIALFMTICNIHALLNWLVTFLHRVILKPKGDKLLLVTFLLQT